jgi:hypothetical protein
MIKRIELYDTLKTENPKFEKYNGLPKMSYSAYTSWTSDTYRGSFVAAKFLGIPDEGNIFTAFGSACGRYLETRNADNPEVSMLLSNKDIEILNDVAIPEGSVFEREIVLMRNLGSMGAYVIIGYIDMNFKDEVEKNCVVDFKTGGSTKSSEYGSDDYKQTRIYSFALETEEQEDIGYVGVELLHRKGNNLIPGDKNVLRLEGTIEKVETPYNNLETAKFLKEKFDPVAIEISDNVKFFKKFFDSEN